MALPAAGPDWSVWKLHADKRSMLIPKVTSDERFNVENQPSRRPTKSISLFREELPHDFADFPLQGLRITDVEIADRPFLVDDHQ
jgi:hypothetical protein